MKKTNLTVFNPKAIGNTNFFMQNKNINHLKDLDLNNNLLLAVNKRIISYPHNKVIPNIGKYQSILYKFNQNFTLIPTNKKMEAPLTPVTAAWVIKMLNSFFTSLYCIINKPVFINYPNKLIIRISFYQSKTYNDSLYFDKNSNFIFNSFNKFKTIFKSWPSKPANLVYKGAVSASQRSEELMGPSKKIWISYFRDWLNLNSYQNNKGGEYSVQASTVNLNKKYNPLSKMLVQKLEHDKQSTDVIPFKLINESVKNTNLIRQKLLSVKAKSTIKNWENKYLQSLLNGSFRPSARIINNIKLQKRIMSLSKGSTTNSKLSIPLLTYLAYKNSIENINNRKLSAKIKKTLIKNLNKRVFLGANKYGPDYYKISNLLFATNSIIDPKVLKRIFNFINNKNLLNSSPSTLAGFKNLGEQRRAALLKLKLSLKIYKNMELNKIKLEEQNKKLLKLIIKLYLSKMHSNINLNTSNLVDIPNLISGTNINKGKILEIISKYLTPLTPISIKEQVYLAGNPSPKMQKQILLNKIKTMFLAYTSISNKTNNNYINNNIVQSNRLKFKYLGILLSKIFGKNVEIQLVRLHNIGLDQNILAKAISSNSKKYKLRIILNKLWKKIQINSGSKFIFLRKKAILNTLINNNNLLVAAKLSDRIGKNIKITAGSKNGPGKMLAGVLSSNKFSIFKNTRKSVLNQRKQISITDTKETSCANISMTSPLDQPKTKNQITNPISNALINDHIENPEIFISKPLSLAKVTGIKIRVAGRLAKERIVPKKTVKTIQVGSLSKQKVSFVDSATFTSKNKKGAFTIKISMSHSFR